MVTNTVFRSWDLTTVNLHGGERDKALIFASLYCLTCVDLLPSLKEISKKYPFDFILFSNGTLDDHKEMVEYFAWDFPVIELDETHMGKLFNVPTTPSLLLLKSDGSVIEQFPLKKKEDIERILEIR